MIFENKKAYEYYKEITEVHGVTIRVDKEAEFTEIEGEAILNSIFMTRISNLNIIKS